MRIFDDTETLLLLKATPSPVGLVFGTGLLKKSKRMFIVTEYLDGGDLMSFIKNLLLHPIMHQCIHGPND